jgi:hypothetical protein
MIAPHSLPILCRIAHLVRNRRKRMVRIRQSAMLKERK